MANAPSDRSLVARIQSGDEDAAALIYERYAKRIHGLVNKQMTDMLHAQTQPEDIVQSVFKSIFRGVASGGYSAPEGGTLWQLMAVVAIHKTRRNASKRQVQKRDARRTQSLEAMEAFDVESDISPEGFESALREAVEHLKTSEQQVVMLRVEGFKVEEISEKLELSRRSVERLLQNAREKLSLMLDLDLD